MGAPPALRADALAWVKHGFFGREGGVSQGIYATLNPGTGSRDDAEAVRENRQRIAGAFGVTPERLMGVHQVHSPDAVFVDAPWTGERAHADALVTKAPDLVISILTADCAPVLFADRDAGVIAAAHAGWKGAIGGVLENTVRLMVQHGARTEHIAAAIGPCIHQASYEVGAEFAERFVAEDPAYARFFVAGKDERKQFDLPGFCASRLAALGLTQIETAPHDTYAEITKFHSHRRSVQENAGDYGRNCSAITLG